MSVKIEVKSEISNLEIIRDTLTELGYTFTERDEVLSINKNFHHLAIDTKSGQITCDSAQSAEVKEIKKQYARNFYRNQAIQEGMNIQEQVSANGTIEIFFTK